MPLSIARQGVSVRPAGSLALELWTACQHPLVPELPVALLE